MQHTSQLPRTFVHRFRASEEALFFKQALLFSQDAMSLTVEARLIAKVSSLFEVSDVFGSRRAHSFFFRGRVDSAPTTTRNQWFHFSPPNAHSIIPSPCRKPIASQYFGRLGPSALAKMGGRTVGEHTAAASSSMLASSSSSPTAVAKSAQSIAFQLSQKESKSAFLVPRAAPPATSSSSQQAAART